MNKRKGIIISAVLFLTGLILTVLFLLQPVKVILNGKPVSIPSFGLTTGDIALDAGVGLTAGDQIQPSAGSLYLGGQPIRLNQISAYLIYLDGELSSIYAVDPIPANVLLTAGIRIFPGDRIQIDGLEVNPQVSHGWKEQHTIQYKRSHPYRLILPDGSTRIASTTLSKPEDILWELGLGNASISLQPVKPISGENKNSQDKIKTFKIILPAQFTPAGSSGTHYAEENSGRLLASTGQAPQGLDIFNNQPASELTSTDVLSVQHVEETLTISQKSLPFQKRTEMDDTLELDQQKVTQSGQYGVAMQLTRTRMKDGEVVAENVEKETVIQPPVDEVVGYGTKINIRTLDAGGKTIEYYRAISMYATSYSPCRSGSSKCSYGTASGETVRKGIVAVIPRWFAYMAGQQVYIPGYGFAIIGDTGGGIPGTNWIDLAYTDEEFVPWHSYVTVYFLTPVPDNILYDIN